MPVVRQLGLLFAIAGSVAIAIVAVLWMQSPDYRPLTGITTAQQASSVAGLLDSNGLPHRVDNRSGVILVPQDRYHEARMILAGANQLDGQQMGYELLDAEQGFGVSQFMELARHRRSVEGELARSISSLDGVAVGAGAAGSAEVDNLSQRSAQAYRVGHRDDWCPVIH